MQNTVEQNVAKKEESHKYSSKLPYVKCCTDQRILSALSKCAPHPEAPRDRQKQNHTNTKK